LPDPKCTIAGGAYTHYHKYVNTQHISEHVTQFYKQSLDARPLNDIPTLFYYYIYYYYYHHYYYYFRLTAVDDMGLALRSVCYCDITFSVR